MRESGTNDKAEGRIARVAARTAAASRCWDKHGMGRLNLSISVDLKRYIDRAVARGQFESPQGLVVEAVTRMKEREVSADRVAEMSAPAKTQSLEPRA